MDNKIVAYHFKKVAALGSLFIFLLSCSPHKDQKVCKIGEEVLTNNELNKRVAIFYPKLNKKVAREKAINDWAKEKRIQLRIQNEFPKKQESRRLKFEKEKMHLHLYLLISEFISTHIDTAVRKKEILQYYREHRSDYHDKTYIVKALYLKVSDSLSKVHHIKDYYLLKNNKDIQKIEKYGHLYATSFYFEKKRWIYFKDLMREIPISNQKKKEIVRKKGHGIFEENGETHFINILDYRIKSVTSPLKSEKKHIRKHILTIRANNLRKTAKKTILKDVQEKYPIIYY